MFTRSGNSRDAWASSADRPSGNATLAAAAARRPRRAYATMLDLAQSTTALLVAAWAANAGPGFMAR